MKKLIPLLLALALLLGCLSAFAEAASYEAMGMTADFDAVSAQSSNYIYILDCGVIKHDPYLAAMLVNYYAIPKDEFMDLNERAGDIEDPQEFELLRQKVKSLTCEIAEIFVTNANSLAEMGFEENLPEGHVLTEFGAVGDYRYYCHTFSPEEVTGLIELGTDLSEYGVTSERDGEAIRADIEAAQSELLKQLQAADLSEIVDPDAHFIGQVISFESVDLDGNPINSADLFRDNRITMVNLWGTWCVNCVDEMAELAELHTRLQEKGCGIVGVECENKPIDEVADAARQMLAENGVTYPNAIEPQGNPIFDQVHSFPTSFFVDSEGRILTYPISGAAVDQYEPTVDSLLAGEAIEAASGTGAAATGTYRVIVRDQEGNPVQGAVIQFCDDTLCDFKETDADGVAAFDGREQKEWLVHVLTAPEGYAPDETEYRTQDTFSDVTIVLEKGA